MVHVLGVLAVLSVIPIIVWWIATYRPSEYGQIGSESYYMSPLLIYVVGGLLAGIVCWISEFF